MHYKATNQRHGTSTFDKILVEKGIDRFDTIPKCKLQVASRVTVASSKDLMGLRNSKFWVRVHGCVFPISPICQCFSPKLLKVVVFPWTWWVVASGWRHLAGIYTLLPPQFFQQQHSAAQASGATPELCWPIGGGGASGRRWHQIAQQCAQTRIMPAGKLLGGSNRQPLLEV